MSTAADHPGPGARTLGALLEAGASTERRTALWYEGRTITYAELSDSARQMAKGLLALGVRRGDRVAGLFANQPEWLVACLAATSVGAVFVPLNTWYKQREIAWTLAHCGVSVLVAMPGFLKQDYVRMVSEAVPELAAARGGRLASERLPALRTVAFTGERVPGALTWDELMRCGDGVDDAALDRACAEVGGDDAAFILYTSGSTADPKGVVLRHGGLVENGFEIGRRRLVDGDDRIWLGSPLFYGLGAANALMVALTHRASLVLHDHFDAGRAIDAIDRTGATVYYGTGNMTQAILSHPDFSRRKVGSLSKGNAGTVSEYKRLTLVELGVRHATPAYGLTESYGHATGGFPDDPLDVKLHTDGLPLPGMEIHIVDPVSSQPLPRGERGLVLLRGRTTPGYFGNPEETARAVRPDGLFDTGDLGSLDGEGRFVFHARLKEVIKSGGINVSPLEVEQLLVTHPDIRDAFVVGVPHPARGELIVAFVLATAPLREDDVRAFVREHAASFKVPHHVLFRSEEQLPRLASGKVAKHLLGAEALRELTG